MARVWAEYLSKYPELGNFNGNNNSWYLDRPSIRKRSTFNIALAWWWLEYFFSKDEYSLEGKMRKREKDILITLDWRLGSLAQSDFVLKYNINDFPANIRKSFQKNFNKFYQCMFLKNVPKIIAIVKTEVSTKNL